MSNNQTSPSSAGSPGVGTSLLSSLPDTLQRVLPRTIPGPISPLNKGALHWGWQGYLAYGCQSTVVVVDSATVEVVQALTGHTAYITKVCWRGTQHYHQLSASYSLLLASGDALGHLRVWDVATGLCSLLPAPANTSRPVADMSWLLGCSEGREHMLLVLYPPHRVVLWDARHQTRLWTKSYTHSLSAFTLDPFNNNNIAFLCEGCVLFVNDFSVGKCPSSNGTKFYIAASSSSSSSPSGNSGGGSSNNASAGSTLRRKVRALVLGSDSASTKNFMEDGSSASPSNTGSCLQLVYHQTSPDLLLMVYPREMLLVDLSINVTVAVLALDRPMPAFVQVVPCWRDDVIVALHETGAVTLHEKRLYRPPGGDGMSELVYEKRCQSEWLRLAKNTQCLGLALDPVHHTKMGIILGDGRVLFKEISAVPNPMEIENRENAPAAMRDITNSYADEHGGYTTTTTNSSKSVNNSIIDALQEAATETQKPISVELSDVNKLKNAESDELKPIKFPDLSISALLKNNQKVRVVVVGCLTPLSASPSAGVVVRMCPPLTTRNLHQYTPRVAVGNSQGSIQIVNAATGYISRDVNVHTCPVRGIEWTSLDSVISFAHQTLTNAQGLVRNELFHVDLNGGIATELKRTAQQESAIHAVRVSYLKQYFLVARKSDPLELWCCRTLCLLRTLPSRFPLPTALEWSPTSHVRKKGGGSASVASTSSTASMGSFGGSTADGTAAGSVCTGVEPGGSISADCSASTCSISNTSLMTGSTNSISIASSGYDSSSTAALNPDISSDFQNLSTSENKENEMNIDLNDQSFTAQNKQPSVARVVKETFMLSDSDGCLYHLSVEGNVIKDGVRVPPDPAVQRVSSIACKSHLMVLADTDSNLSLWDLNSRSSGHVNTGRGWVRKIRFAPGRDNMKLLVIFADGADIWDMKLVTRVGQLKGGSGDGLGAGLRVVDGDWAASDRPILATSDGCLRVMDTELKHCTSHVLHYCTHEPVGSPHLLAGEASLNLRTLLTQQHWKETSQEAEGGEDQKNKETGIIPRRYSLQFTEEDGFTKQQLRVIATWVSRLPGSVRAFLEQCHSTLHRCLLVAAVFGDCSELRFWTIAAHYLPNAAMTCHDSTGTNRATVGNTAVLANSVPALATAYDLYCDSRNYRARQLERLSLHESKLLTGTQKARLCRQLSLLGERDRAVGLLLDMEPGDPGYYTCCLRACLVAGTQHSAQSSSTIKLVATNLIAAARVEEGVELLCLVGKATEAVGYLQSYGRWKESVWLARCCPMLHPQDNDNQSHLNVKDRRSEVCNRETQDPSCGESTKTNSTCTSATAQALVKWSNHLLQNGDKEGSSLALLSSGSVWAAVEQLSSQHYHQRAALLLHAAVELAALPPQILPQYRTSSDDPGGAMDRVTPDMIALSDNIHRKYALYLFGLGNKPGVGFYCRHMGEAGGGLMSTMGGINT